MKILSMTATFGKLSHQTLSFEPGLNVITAPNEWGKSTWCAFITAMLYGIDTRERSTQATLADKERYAPWSGEPMSGRMDIFWNGRAITLERRTKGRSVFGEFQAYETDSGIAVPELTGTNCGQVLLGVEKSVFVRTGFIKLTDLPVAQDEALRRRLNALVTTGDESGASDALEKSLRDLKNKCRFNKSGLLPQAQVQRQQVQDSLDRLHQLQQQTQQGKDAMLALEEKIRQLENHKAALEYDQHRQHAQKLVAANILADNAREALVRQEEAAKTLPDRQQAESALHQLRLLRDQQDQLHTQARLLSPPPVKPDTPAIYQGLSPEDALRQTQTDLQVYNQAKQEARRRAGGIAAALLALIGVLALLLIPHGTVKAVGAAAILAGLILLRIHYAGKKRSQNTEKALQYKYSPVPPEQWVDTARRWGEAYAKYEAGAKEDRNRRDALDAQLADLTAQIAQLTEGAGIRAKEEYWQDICQQWDNVTKAASEYQRNQELAQALSSVAVTVTAPTFEDTLTDPPESTKQQLYAARERKEQLHRQLGQLQGQMELCGSEEALVQQLQALDARIAKLENTYAALTLAQDTLAQAAAALQRRFAPQITKRTQELFCKLTGQRYDRLTLGSDLRVDVGAKDEDTLHNMLWRSDGTADQLYLALRLAVAEALTPDAPIILDDALVRFDDDRLAQAMAILREASAQKQVLVFTCQSRESQL